MVLNDLTKEPTITAAWVTEVDKRLTDEVGHAMLAYGDELIVERRGKVIYMHIQWQMYANWILDRIAFESIDETDVWLCLVVNTIKGQFPLPETVNGT